MKKADVKIGEQYVVKVSGKLQVVKLDHESQYGGWIGINVRTGREIRIRSAAKLRMTKAANDELMAKVRARRPRYIFQNHILCGAHCNETYRFSGTKSSDYRAMLQTEPGKCAVCFPRDETGTPAVSSEVA